MTMGVSYWEQITLMLATVLSSLEYTVSTGIQVPASTNGFGGRTMYVVAVNHHTPVWQPAARVRRTAAYPPEQQVPREPTVKILDVNCQITARFSETVVVSHLENMFDEDLESLFTVQLPEVAFISNFTMVIDGVLHVAQVMEKSEAEAAYETAKQKNKTAGHVSGSVLPTEPIMKKRGMEVFNVAINIKAKSTAQFTLTYLQLLQRDLGVYEYIASVRPRQLVDNLNINIKIYEPQGIKYVDVYEPAQNSITQTIAKVNRRSPTIMEVSYSPDRDQQGQIMQAQDSHSGIDGDLVIRYDVNHGQDAGHVQVDGDFFVHYFSPSGLKALPKNIVFVIDRSGSMSGEKLEQTRQAMLYILDQLLPTDAFQMIYFDDKLQFWSDEHLVEASPEMVDNAKNHIQVYLKSGGSTNINSALVEACRVLRHQGIKGSSFIVFLTDGHPTSGVTDSKSITRNVKEASAGEVVVFSLGFGFDLQFDLLKEISYNTDGTVRRIYPGTDAADQIKDFLLGVNTPLMYEIQLVYEDSAVMLDSLTKHSFPQYFNGSELIVAGRLRTSTPSVWSVNVVGVNDKDEEMKYKKDISSIEEDMSELEKQGIVVTGFVERLWAYLSIMDLLKQHLIAEGSRQQEQLYDKALGLALKYNLVTPVTSLFIVEAERKQSADAVFMEGGLMVVSAKVQSACSTIIPQFCLYVICCIFFIVNVIMRSLV